MLSLSSNDSCGSDSDEVEKWENMMFRKRCVEFWTTDPNAIMPNRDEKILILQQFRTTPDVFFRRLGAYSLPTNIDEEFLLKWDGTPKS